MYLWIALITIISVATRSNGAFYHSNHRRPATSRRTFGTPKIYSSSSPFLVETDLSSSLISQLAVLALKLRLADQTSVSCDVTAPTVDLLFRGRIGPVTIRGKGWKSGGGLTCRAIEANVETCELDIGRILSDRKLILKTPASGKAIVGFNSTDFGNFLTYPLMKLPRSSPTEPTTNIQFIRDGIIIDPIMGTVLFPVFYGDQQWNCELRRATGSRRAAIRTFPSVTDLQPDEMELGICNEITHVLSEFFNEMVFELDGTFLSFQDMCVTDRGESPCVMLALNILVKKFPSPGLDF